MKTKTRTERIDRLTLHITREFSQGDIDAMDTFVRAAEKRFGLGAVNYTIETVKRKIITEVRDGVHVRGEKFK